MPKTFESPGTNCETLSSLTETSADERQDLSSLVENKELLQDRQNYKPIAGDYISLEEVYIKHRRHVFAFVRWKRGYNYHDAEDLTQAFFLHLHKKDILKRANLAKGSLETFLNAVLANFLNNVWNNRNSLKRGRGVDMVPILTNSEEKRLGHHEPIDFCTPRQIIDEQQSATIVTETLELLRQEYSARKKTDLCRTLEEAIFEDLPLGSISNLAKSLRMAEGTLRVSLHRLRRRFGELLRSRIATPPGDHTQIEDAARIVIMNFAKMGFGLH